MKTKNIEKVYTPTHYHWVGDGFRVNNFFPSNYGIGMQRMSPFILLDYNSKHYFPPTDKPRGVGVHPHRGFETVTIAYKGKVQHHDSNGGGGIIEEGDVQWMTAASGILHKEYHEKEWSKKGGDFHVVQLWVNLPAKYKMSNPKYQAITNDNIAKHLLEDEAGIIEVIAGNFKETKGAATTFSPMHLYNLKQKAKKETSLDFPTHYNTALLVIEGKIKVNKEEVIEKDSFVLMKNEGESFSIETLEDSVVLILSGEPIAESIAARGPFVMNTDKEIKEAYEDFYEGKFGYLED